MAARSKNQQKNAIRSTKCILLFFCLFFYSPCTIVSITFTELVNILPKGDCFLYIIMIEYIL